MKTVFVMLAIAAAGMIGVAAPSKEDAEASARSWLALIDSQKYEESWAEAGSFFRSSVKQQDWVQQVKNVRGGMGSLTMRKPLKTTMAKSLPGAPDGEYAVVQFDTVLKNKAKAVETIPMMLEDGKWKAAGYFIK
jgi:hypothetical protein